MTMKPAELTDPMAAITAERQISGILTRALEPFSFNDADGESAVFDLIDPDHTAHVLVGNFSARWERSMGQRRIVLSGGWEIDPGEVVA